MTIYKEVVIDLETGEETKIEFTAKELLAHETAIAEAEAQAELEAQAKAAARQATIDKLAALGLTPEDLAALNG